MSLTGFEGPEKIVEFVFSIPENCDSDFRVLERSVWDEVLEEASCYIKGKITNEHLHAYILSESSMFVYKNSVIVKTCGTTTLLKICPLIKELGSKLKMELQWITYSRKNFNYPDEQKYPHQTFISELNYLSTYFQGEGFILGPLTSDHWYFYVADYTPLDQISCTDISLNLYMYDMNEKISSLFFESAGYTTEQVTEISGISKIFPGSKIHSFNFIPCGYSMNGLYGSNYWTIHVTPESHCSYVSFETSVKLNSYTNLIQLVLSIFKPKRFTLSIFADEWIMNQLEVYPYDVEQLSYEDAQFGNADVNSNNSDSQTNGSDSSRELKYYRTSSSSSDLSNGYTCGVGNWYLANDYNHARMLALGLASKYIDENEGEL